MASLDIALTVDQIMESLRQLSDAEQRRLAATILADRKLEGFVEELHDHLACEEAPAEGPAEPFAEEDLARQ